MVLWFLTLIVLQAVASLGYLTGSRDATPLLHSPVKPKEQEKAVKQLIYRLIGDRSNDFIIYVNPHFNGDKEAFQILSSDGVVRITGSNGVSASSGFHHYLKYYCNCHVSWEANQLKIPQQWPKANLTITFPQKARYYQNVCTSSYSFVWWKWEDWEKHIDWMALNGINLPLASTGQEAIWKRVYESLGLTQADIDKYFTGSAFLAWNRMGNIHGWGGSLPSHWHAQRLVLQHQILNRMRSFGMIPILPAFAGFIPDAISRIFPSAKVSRLPRWGHFNSTYCCSLFLDPLDPLFQRIGTLFLKELISEFGTNHVYNCDSFNEMKPPSMDPSYIRTVGISVFNSMTKVDPSAVWLMQGWLFRDNKTWQEPQAKALLTSVPIGRMIVLDLEAEINPVYPTLRSFYGQPFIWCMLHNFGGTLGLYGNLNKINEGVFAASIYPNSSMLGIGITPEGINQNYVMYDFMMEMGWRKKPVQLDEWIKKYAKRRYGVNDKRISQAWKLLQDSAYNSILETWRVYHDRNTSRDKMLQASSCDELTWIPPYHGNHIVTRRPSLNLRSVVLYRPNAVYKASQLMQKSWDSMKNCSTFRHDLVDILRETLQLGFSSLYKGLVYSYKHRNASLFNLYGSTMLKVLDVMEDVLSTEKAFLLDPWIKTARNWGTTDKEKQLLEFNARVQITLWGPTGEILDYATKQWSGVVRGYYRPRWRLFIERLASALLNNQCFNQTQFNQDVFNYAEKPFTTDTSVSGEKEYGIIEHVLPKYNKIMDTVSLIYA